MAKDATRGTRIQSVSRAVELLKLIATLPEGERTVNRIAKELGSSVPTAYHMLNTLVDSTMLMKDDRRQYQFGLAMELLVAAHARQTVIPPELVAPLRHIVDSTGESAYLSAWRDGAITVLERMRGAHAVQVINLDRGFRGAANARASGKVLLAFAPGEDRERYLATHRLEAATPHSIVERGDFDREITSVLARGYAEEIEEFSEGVACLAVPILKGSLLLGCYTISAPVERFRSDSGHFLEVLQQAVAMVDGGVPRSTSE
ncbi:IclR family transcriptional regulator (plasmid) [Rhodococcus sp. USK10]|uniref:IclR family transcriptional regulator n=1 Tax=Rhodococcus sp. USK10 TaxID=2789739 RepID=UPI001C6078B8|nr:IclR family transcriptional regulator [Rhodococcus sp. USK10]QYB00188.1 IclR family transcriptional regulator [Rhodococcus sp. USK10]